MGVLNRLAIGFFATVIILCLLQAYRFVDPKYPWLICGILIIFNLFFASLFLWLNGDLTLKVGILTVGNILGLLWNALFYQLLIESCRILAIPFDAAFTIASPILNLMWIVPFWSISLSYLPRLQPYDTRQQGRL